jgi:hypothetical protein
MSQMHYLKFGNCIKTTLGNTMKVTNNACTPVSYLSHWILKGTAAGALS